MVFLLVQSKFVFDSYSQKKGRMKCCMNDAITIRDCNNSDVVLYRYIRLYRGLFHHHYADIM